MLVRLERIAKLCAHIVLLRQLTGIGSPGLYPLASSTLFSGSCPLTALERAMQNEDSASSANRQELVLEDMLKVDKT